MFDTNAQTVEITEKRLKEIASLVKVWLSKFKATKRDLQSLLGKLVV